MWTREGRESCKTQVGGGGGGVKEGGVKEGRGVEGVGRPLLCEGQD